MGDSLLMMLVLEWSYGKQSTERKQKQQIWVFIHLYTATFNTMQDEQQELRKSAYVNYNTQVFVFLSLGCCCDTVTGAVATGVVGVVSTSFHFPLLLVLFRGAPLEWCGNK